MATAVSPVQEAHDLLQGRLAELNEALEEKERIEAAIDALPLNGNGPTSKPGRRRPGRPAKAGTKATAKGRTRAKRSGTRADQAVALVAKHPEGISATDIAKVMKIKPNYLYRVMGDLEKEKLVRKDGRTYFPPKS